ncbi:MAG: STAS domain-containing protein [Prochlorococcaceae cyanobacterium]|jgi:anti-sigma B factor antagonist
MKLSRSVDRGWQVIQVVGQIDSKTAGDLRDYLDQEISAGLPVALDVSEVPFMSSAGLRTLLMLHRRTEELSVALALVGLNELIVDTMKVTGFYEYFTSYPDLPSLPSKEVSA